MTNLGGRTALITGASSGIGREFARQLHSLGCNLVVTARRMERLIELKQELERFRPDSVECVAADLTKRSSNGDNLLGLEELVSRLEKIPIDIFINNAGVGSFGPFEKIPSEYENNIILLNIYATTMLAQFVINKMKASRQGMYLCVSSIAGFQPLPFMATYSASKAFNLFQTLALRYELRGYNISVTALCPGPTETEFFGVAQLAAQPPDLRRAEVQDVVNESIRAMLKNKAVVAPGWKGKLMVLVVRFLPLSITTTFSGRFLGKCLPKSG
ncbi:MAG: SDR family oxidoreductase [Deltaproteobacteria bacterium]|nr:SDR family oxidoreductase [Deltaproteobacteria bacterium]